MILFCKNGWRNVSRFCVIIICYNMFLLKINVKFNRYRRKFLEYTLQRVYYSVK